MTDVAWLPSISLNLLWGCNQITKQNLMIKKTIIINNKKKILRDAQKGHLKRTNLCPDRPDGPAQQFSKIQSPIYPSKTLGGFFFVKVAQNLNPQNLYGESLDPGINKISKNLLGNINKSRRRSQNPDGLRETKRKRQKKKQKKKIEGNTRHDKWNRVSRRLEANPISNRWRKRERTRRRNRERKCVIQCGTER